MIARESRLFSFTTLFLALGALWFAQPASAQISVDSGIYDDVSLTISEQNDSGWVLVEDGDKTPATKGDAAQRFAGDWVDEDAITPSRTPIYAAGPFYLVSADTVEMIGTVDSDSPAAFAQMLARYPTIRRLVMVDCPGSVDEDANRLLARTVRRAGLTTIVPAGGSVRSGAVDLFLAGRERIAAANAEFGVHAWRDADGLGPADFAANDPVNQGYIDYYREMGMSTDAASRFYALTNATPFDSVRYLSANDMAQLGLVQIGA
ncbi:MAG: alpha/beta hydrolase [Sphingomonadaceae bacterium]|nr:alpha/beta hydrolase [Sphingomonadaceae bacterium]